MSEQFHPTRQMVHELSGGRTVKVQTDGEKFGLVFFNGEEETRCLLSRGAMQALASSYPPLANGHGEDIIYKWMVAVEHKIISAALKCAAK